MYTAPFVLGEHFLGNVSLNRSSVLMATEKGGY